jgi:vitamin B12 transporter
MRLRLVSGCVLLTLVGISPALADAAPEPPSYDVYVSDEGEIVEQIAPKRVVDESRIEERSARTLDEALAFEPGIYVRKGNEGTPRIDMRGLRSRHVLLLLDGIPFNSTEDGQFDPVLIPVELMQSVRIDFGNASVLHGDGPIGGVLQVVTRTPEEGLQTRAGFDVRSGNQYFVDLSVSARAGNFDALAAGSGFGRDAFPLSDHFDASTSEDGGARNNADRERYNGLLKLGWTPTETLRVGALIAAVGGKYGIPPNAIDDPTDPFASRVRFERVEDHSGLSGQLSAQWDPSGPLELRSWAYVNDADEHRARYDDADYDSITNDRISGTFDAENDATIYGSATHLAYDLGALGRIKGAFQYRREEFDTEGVIRDVRQGGGRFGLRSFDESSHQAVYNAGVEWEIAPFTDTGLVLGYGHSWIDKDTGNSDDGPTFLAGAFWNVVDGTHLRASASRKLRFPSLRQLHEVSTGNPDLEAETAWSYEIGVAQSLPGATLLDVTGYWMDVEDFIEVDATSNLFENNDRYRFRGFEVALDTRPLEPLYLHLSYSFLDSENRSPGTAEDQLPNRPEHRFAFESRVQLPLETSVRVALEYVANQIVYSRLPPTRSRSTGDYFLADLRLEKEFSGDRLALYFGVENIADEDYQRSYGVPDAGRTYIGGLRLKL